MNEILRTDIDQYPDHYRVIDKDGTLVGLLPQDFDTYDMISVVDELTPPKEPQPLPPGAVGYGPNGPAWVGFQYQMPAAASDAYRDWLNSLTLTPDPYGNFPGHIYEWDRHRSAYKFTGGPITDRDHTKSEDKDE